jgi:hypothetical protein
LPAYLVCPSLPGTLAVSRAGVSLPGPARPPPDPLSASNSAHESGLATSHRATLSSHISSLPTGPLDGESLPAQNFC